MLVWTDRIRAKRNWDITSVNRVPYWKARMRANCLKLQRSLCKVTVRRVKLFFNSREYLAAVKHLFLRTCLLWWSSSIVSIAGKLLLLEYWILCLVRDLKQLNQIRNTVFINPVTGLSLATATLLHRTAMLFTIIFTVDRLDPVILKELLTQRHFFTIMEFFFPALIIKKAVALLIRWWQAWQSLQTG